MSIVQHFAKNAQGRDLIVGDIHGHFTKLQAALDAAGFKLCVEPQPGCKLCPCRLRAQLDAARLGNK